MKDSVLTLSDMQKKYVEDMTDGELEDCLTKFALPDDSPFILTEAMFEYASLVYSCKLKMQHMGWGN